MLARYHKQKLDKAIVQKLRDINKKYELNYKLDSDLDYIKLSVFKNALSQKEVFEKTYEAIRSKYFDMWDRLSFNERNEILLQDSKATITGLRSFQFEDTAIYIPFFDRLLNSLYANETAILELPQFFELYEKFNEKIIPLEFYGIAPLVAGFSDFTLLLHQDHKVVLYDTIKRVFYKVSENDFKRYPIDVKKSLNDHQLNTLAHAICSQEDLFYDHLIEYEAIKKRCIKKILKLRKKETKK